jgi:hypothetical protein
MNGQSRSHLVRRPTDRHLRYAAAALAYLVAALHLFHPTLGFGRLVVILSADPGLLVADPRPLAFVLSGLALVVGVPAAAGEDGLPRKPVYAAGLGLVATYLVGYFAWHLSGHGGFLPGREPLYHGLAPHEAVIAHMSGEPWAAASVAFELLLGAALVALYRRAN